MKKTILTTLFLVVAVLMVIAQGTAEIKFEKTTHNFELFPKITLKSLANSNSPIQEMVRW